MPERSARAESESESESEKAEWRAKAESEEPELFMGIESWPAPVNTLLNFHARILDEYFGI